MLSKRFAELGARLVLWDINQAGNEETAEQVKAIGATARTYTVDLSSREAIYKTAQQVLGCSLMMKTYLYADRCTVFSLYQGKGGIYTLYRQNLTLFPIS